MMDATSAFLAGFTAPVIICLIIGVGLLIFEMFTPGFGVAGGLGLLLLVLAVALHARTLAGALMFIALILVILLIAFFIFVRLVSKGGLRRSSLVNSAELTRQEGFSSNEDMMQYMGRHGTAQTVLRPAGTADFDGVKLDVVTEGEFLPAGSRIVVQRVEGRRIVVRQEATPASSVYVEGQQGVPS